MADANELDDLDGLLTHPGYQRLMTYAGHEWGPAGARFQQAVQMAAAKPDTEATAFLRCILFAQTEIKRLLEHPAERVSQLRNKAAVVPSGPSRRGTGL